MKRPSGPACFSEPRFLKFRLRGLVWWSKTDRWLRCVRWYCCTCSTTGPYPCAHVQGWIRMKLPQVPDPKDASNVGSGWTTSAILTGLDTLNEFLSNPSWEGGVARGERSLMTFVKNGSTTAILKVENPALKLVVAAASFDEALAALEACLRQPTPPFQVDDNPLGRGSKKRK